MSLIRIDGQLAEPAFSRLQGHGQFVVVMLIDHPKEPILVEQPFGQGAAAGFAASKAAAQLRRGAHVVVYGDSFTRGRMSGKWVLKLCNVAHVERPVAPSFHEPETALAG